MATKAVFSPDGKIRERNQHRIRFGTVSRTRLLLCGARNLLKLSLARHFGRVGSSEQGTLLIWVDAILRTVHFPWQVLQTNHPTSFIVGKLKTQTRNEPGQDRREFLIKITRVSIIIQRETSKLPLPPVKVLKANVCNQKAIT